MTRNYCPVCNGSGNVQDRLTQTDTATSISYMPCPNCEGTGWAGEPDVLVALNPDTISLRDYFAGMALMGMIIGWQIRGDASSDRAKWAYKQADAMLKER